MDTHVNKNDIRNGGKRVIVMLQRLAVIKERGI